MALLIRGKTKCLLCDQVIRDGDEVVSFSPFVTNRHDPLFRYSDAAFHAAHFWQQPDAARAMARWNRQREENAPDRRRCAVCGLRIENPDDHFTTGLLSDSEPASEFNFVHLHRSHLGSWLELDRAIAALESLVSNGEWDDSDIDKVLEPLRRARTSRIN